MAWATLFLVAWPARSTAENIVKNGSFEDGLTGWAKVGAAKHAALDDAVAHSGSRSLRISGPGGMRTSLVPYRGGTLKVSGWIKTDRVIAGSRPWFKAALQVISYDESRKSAGHRDVALLEGTQDWARFECKVLLSREVAYVAVHCTLWGPDVKGCAWFDDVVLEELDSSRARARDLQKATVTVEFNRDLGEFRHLWTGSDAGHMDRVATPTQINAMRHARRFGFRYLRMHNCIHNPGIYSEDTAGNPVFTWDKFDERIAAAVDNGMWPVICLEGMPPELAVRDDGKNWQNPHPPRGPQEYLKWQQICRELVRHCRARWGDSIHHWYFEVWNEPDARGYFSGTFEEYLKLYDHAVAGATSADPAIRIGGPAGAGTEWCQPFLEHCASGNNDATGGPGCRLDFLSWHIYTVGAGIPVFEVLRRDCEAVREAIDAVPQYQDIPTIITEWGCASSPHPVHDRPFDAAFRTMAVGVFLDHGITLALPFSLGSGPPHAHDGFQGDLALFTKTSIPKPGFRAFELLHRMTGRRVLCASSNDPVGGLACLAPDERQAWVMLYNLVEKHGQAPYETDVTVELSGLPSGDWKCRATAIAPEQCDPFVRWKAIGSPEKLSKIQYADLMQASTLPPATEVPLQGRVLNLRMPGFSVLHLELER